MNDDPPINPIDDESLSDDDEAPAPTEQPTVSATSVGEVRRRERKKKREAREAEEFWRAVFASPVGRREVWKILEAAGTFEVRFAASPGGFPDPNATWFHFGQRELGQRLYLGWQHRLPDEVRAMHLENDWRFSDKPRKAD